MLRKGEPVVGEGGAGGRLGCDRSAVCAPSRARSERPASRRGRGLIAAEPGGLPRGYTGRSAWQQQFVWFQVPGNSKARREEEKEKSTTSCNKKRSLASKRRTCCSIDYYGKKSTMAFRGCTHVHTRESRDPESRLVEIRAQTLRVETGFTHARSFGHLGQQIFYIEAAL